LYVPKSWPVALDDGAFRSALTTGRFAFAALNVLKAFAGDDLEWDEAASLTSLAYGAAWPPAVTPLVQLDAGAWALELIHGPSLSFKDVAMQLIGPLYEFALKKRDKRLSVVCATSGDTGGAAVEALKGRERVDLFVLLPKGRVSDVQRRFMTASGAANVHAIEIDGDFDACQAIVKAMFADTAFAKRAALSGVNSINWARIVAQSVYFHIAANILAAAGPVHFSVPTGNFGDAFSGYVAKRMGAPIGKILLATNANDILARALASGRYQRAEKSAATLSPAMDIQVASNFERIVFEALGRDGDATRRLYDQFNQTGGFDLPPKALAFLRESFAAAAVSDTETQAAMRHARAGGYVACPHTAVALSAAAKLDPPLGTPRVTLATAHPAKFPETVTNATGLTPPLPEKCADLFDRGEILASLANDAAAVQAFIREKSRAWA
ncbi:MAG: threonine synthase, partial [Hyphomonadaceae bacterium]